VGEAHAEPEPGHATDDEPVDVRPGVRAGQAHPGGEDELAALQEGGGVLQLAHGDPADRPVEVPPPGEDGQVERCDRHHPA